MWRHKIEYVLSSAVKYFRTFLLWKKSSRDSRNSVIICSLSWSATPVWLSFLHGIQEERKCKKNVVFRDPLFFSSCTYNNGWLNDLSFKLAKWMYISVCSPHKAALLLCMFLEYNNKLYGPFIPFCFINYYLFLFIVVAWKTASRNFLNFYLYAPRMCAWWWVNDFIFGWSVSLKTVPSHCSHILSFGNWVIVSPV